MARLSARMLLQIHDELIFEVPAYQLPDLAQLVTEEMVGGLALNVPLKVDIKPGPNWAEMQCKSSASWAAWRAERAPWPGEFARLGGGVLDADRAAHEVLRLPEIEAAARRRWGEAVFGPDGRIDRQRLAGIVFAAGPEGERERKYLEQLTHPVIARADSPAGRRGGGRRDAAAVLDAPLLWEAGWNGWCEKSYLSTCRGRSGCGGHWPAVGAAEDFAAREAAQESLERKRASADAMIDNSGSPERTRAQVERFWASLFP